MNSEENKPVVGYQSSPLPNKPEEIMAAIAPITNANLLLGRKIQSGEIPWQITKRSGNRTAGSHPTGVPNTAL